MANACETTPLKELNDQSERVIECKTPPLPNQEKKIEMSSERKNSCKCKASPGLLGTPDLKVPKPFKFPERYTSPTDHIMSPISKGLLARTRRGGPLLPPSKIQSKIHELQSPEVSQVQLKMDQ